MSKRNMILFATSFSRIVCGVFAFSSISSDWNTSMKYLAIIVALAVWNATGYYEGRNNL